MILEQGSVIMHIFMLLGHLWPPNLIDNHQNHNEALALCPQCSHLGSMRYKYYWPQSTTSGGWHRRARPLQSLPRTKPNQCPLQGGSMSYKQRWLSVKQVRVSDITLHLTWKKKGANTETVVPTMGKVNAAHPIWKPISQIFKARWENA